MPFAQHQGAKLYWDEQGEGDPLLLIMGLGSTSRLWERIRPALAEHFRTVTLDNRGIGRSTLGNAKYSMALMAADAAAVLDAAEIESAHVFGTSMGGMIAQELALSFPHRVRSLLLGCTMAGGATAIRAPRPETEGLTPEQAERALISLTYHPSTAQKLIEQDRELCGIPDAAVYKSQVLSMQNWECFIRLPEIAVPTLILHGDADQRIPFDNAPLIASQIPDAKVVTITDAGHVFLTDQPAATTEAVLDFLLEFKDA